MISVSVLMSVYNESIIQVSKAINSILSQSFSDFELIIVNDNPDNKEMLNFFSAVYSENDKIKIINNEKNIGLANSMNKALEIARGKYIARMDADDISHEDRLAIEYNILEMHQVDFVFSGFAYIDENDNIINKKKYDYYKPDEIPYFLYKNNIIHHPTVMFSKKLIEKIGKYRNFPCSQDYDLWLRFSENGCRFMMIDKILLYYRIRGNSITAKKGIQQKFTIEYIQKLALERKKNRFDSFTDENYNEYITFMMRKYEKYFIFFQRDLTILSEANDLHNKFMSLCLKTKIFVTNKLLRDSFIRKRKYLKKIYGVEKSEEYRL